MESNTKWFHTIEAVLAVLVVFMGFFMFLEKNKEEIRKISVVVQNSDDTQWSAFRYGLKMAAQDQKMELSVASTGDILTAEEEMDVINREIDLGADAVIVQPVPEKELAKELKKIEKKVPVMLVESILPGEQEESPFPVVEPKQDAMGQVLAKELVKDYSGNLAGKKYGLVMETYESKAMKNRRKGFEEELKDMGAEFCWAVFDSVGENFLEQKPKVDFVIALDNHSLITAAELAAANNLHGALVYGIGNSTEAVYYLDTGIVECLVVPDTFSVGYQSLTETAESLGHYFHKMESRTVSYTVIRREELFTKKNQEILFTMSQ